ncbi:MAG: glycosyltransferase family 39 protein, partial [Candidatus Hydrogenedentales bacterium]
VSWTCFVLAMAALYYLARLDVPRVQARRAVLLTAVFPFAFFFGAVYSESMFLLFTVLAFYGFRTRRWMLGGVSASIAIVTRVPGILMMPALAWLAWKHVEPTRRDRLMALAGLSLSLTGFAWYCIYIYQLSGNAFEWVATIQRWNYYPGGAPWKAPLDLMDKLLMHPYTYLSYNPMALYDTLYGVTGLIFLGLTPVVWRRFGAAYGLYMLLNLWLPLSSGVFEGVGRYCSILFPAFIWMATIRSRNISTALVVLFAMVYMFGFTLFLNNKPLF